MKMAELLLLTLIKMPFFFGYKTEFYPSKTNPRSKSPELFRKNKISRFSLSRSRRDPLKHFEISVLRHIRCAELRRIPIQQPYFTNEHVI